MLIFVSPNGNSEMQILTTSWNWQSFNPIHDFTNKIVSRDLNYIVDVFMWPKFGNSTILTRKVIISVL